MTYIFLTSDFAQLFFHIRFFIAAFRNPQPNQTGPAKQREADNQNLRHEAQSNALNKQ